MNSPLSSSYWVARQRHASVCCPGGLASARPQEAAPKLPLKSIRLLLSLAALALFTAPLEAWAHANPDFEHDAQPILSVQPYLIEKVRSLYDVQERGIAKYPGDDDHAPVPPYIFNARPLGSQGPYNLRLLIQPGPPGHILRVVDMTKVHLPPPPSATPHQVEPAVANNPAPPSAVSAKAPKPTAPTQQPAEPTADTPSGPILDSGAPAPSTPSLAPPPDPASTNH